MINRNQLTALAEATKKMIRENIECTRLILSIVSLALDACLCKKLKTTGNLPTLFPFNPYQASKEICLGILLGIVQFPLHALLIKHIRETVKNEKWLHVNPLDTANDYFAALNSCLTIPLNEEIHYRGYVNNLFVSGTFASAKRLRLAEILISSLLFSFMHSGIDGKIFTLLLGMEYAVLTKLFNGSLWCSTSSHITHNTLCAFVHRANHAEKSAEAKLISALKHEESSSALPRP